MHAGARPPADCLAAWAAHATQPDTTHRTARHAQREAKVQAQKANASLEASKKKLVDSLLSHERGKVSPVGGHGIFHEWALLF